MVAAGTASNRSAAAEMSVMLTISLRYGRIFFGTLAMISIAGLILAPAASAHGVGGVQPSNYETVIKPITPRLPGVSVSAVDLGAKLELTNSSKKSVTVLGYEGEPYLRVGPNGVFRNRLSPATYINRTRTARGAVPQYADATAPPKWIRISSGNSVLWHDHRAHWMGIQDPAAVRSDPDTKHTVQSVRIELTRGDQTYLARGTVRWVPGPAIGPWLLFAVVLAVGLALLSRTRIAAAVVMSALGLAAFSEVVHVLGAWNATTATFTAKLGASIYGLGGIAITLVALIWVARRGVTAAAPIVMMAGVFLLLAGGLADITVLSRSQIPSVFAPAVARLTVTLAIGLGFGLGLAGALRLGTATKRGEK